MLAVSKLSPGQEAYYERSVADGIDDYYAGRGESPGVWVGRGAAELELEGVVGEGELGRLISGRHPLTGAQLRSQAPIKQTTIERIDPASGERYLEEKPLKPVAGYDLVFSPPKSVSLLHALGSDEVRHAVNQAHLAAWQAALAYLEERACVTRKGKNGRERERGSGFVAAAYQHRTSRAQDPHLHTHVIVANMARSPDRTFRALDGQPILKHYRLAAGYLYQSQLRFELTRSLGVEWREPVHGMAEIADVPDEVLKAFSQRRLQVLDYLERQGSSGFYAAKVAAIETRDRKEPIDLPRLRDEWRARAAEHGLGRRQLKRLLGRTVAHELGERELAQVAAHLAGPEGLTEKRSTFAGTDAVMAWAQAHTQGAPVEQVLARVERFIGLDEVVSVERAALGRPAVFSTAELLRHERAALKLAAPTRPVRTALVSEPTIERVAREQVGALGAEQQALLRTVATSPDRVVCVVGHAGAGKTAALGALAEAYRRDGYVAIGAAPSGVAAANLEARTGIPSGTLHRLLAEARERGGLPRGCVLMVDEAGMADTRTLTRLLFQVDYADGKAVLVGDPAQLSAVGPGGLFAALVERNGAIELHDSRRQRDELERRALALLRQGASRDYLAHSAEQGRLVVGDSRTEAKAQLVADWWRAASTDLVGSVMIAYRRADVAELNRVARALLDREGMLGSKQLRLDSGLELAAGDRVLCTRNDRRLAVANGSRGTVLAVDRAQGAVVVELDDQRRLTLPARYLDAGDVSHAYALTGHKTQGLTVERAFVLAHGEAALKEWGYVTLSRARSETRLYTVARAVDPNASPHRIEPAGPLERLADALSRPAAQTLATDAATTGADSPLLPERVRLARQSRQLADRKRALEKERVQGAQQLHQTRRELAGLGMIGRARRGGALRDQIGEREERLVRFDRELERLDRQLRVTRERALELVRTQPRPERGLTRERGIGRAPERSLGRKIEL
jgi:conjugative relaxase-like TrwC/TraI family protein